MGGATRSWSAGAPMLQHSSTPLPRVVPGFGLVSEQWTESRDDRDKPSVHEFLNHCFNVFVGRRSLFVEQIPLPTNYAASQRSLHELLFSEPLAHAQTRFAPGPFAAGTVRQRPGPAFTVA